GQRRCPAQLVHILDSKINDSLEQMVQINSNNEVGSCLPYSTSSTANTAVPALPKCGSNFSSRLRGTRCRKRFAMQRMLSVRRWIARQKNFPAARELDGVDRNQLRILGGFTNAALRQLYTLPAEATRGDAC